MDQIFCVGVYLLNAVLLDVSWVCDPQMSMTIYWGVYLSVGASELCDDRLGTVWNCVQLCEIVYVCLCPGSLGSTEKMTILTSVGHSLLSATPLPCPYKSLSLLWGAGGGEQMPFLLQVQCHRRCLCEGIWGDQERTPKPIWGHIPPICTLSTP